MFHHFAAAAARLSGQPERPRAVRVAAGYTRRAAGRGLSRYGEGRGRQVRDGADPVAERNRLGHNGFGILVADGGRGRFADNTVAESATAAVAATGGATVELHGALVRGGAGATGLLAGEGASVTATGGEIQGVALAVVASGGAQVRRGLRWVGLSELGQAGQ